MTRRSTPCPDCDTPSAPDRESGAKPDPRDILDRLRGMASAWNALPSGPMGWLCFPEHYREAAAEIVRLRTALAAAEKERDHAKATLDRISVALCGRPDGFGDIVPYVQNEIDGRRAAESARDAALADNATLAAECKAWRACYTDSMDRSPNITNAITATDSTGALLRASGRKEADRAE